MAAGAGIEVKEPNWVVRGGIATPSQYTMQVPFPLPMDLAVALSAVFKQMPNPARFPGP